MGDDCSPARTRGSVRPEESRGEGRGSCCSATPWESFSAPRQKGQRARREVEAPWGGGEQSCLLQPWEENLPAAKRREEGDSAEAGLRKGGAGRKGAAMRCERLLELRRRHGRSTAPWWLLLP
ncbi:hypothetical protein Zm00014a_001747 [Zea mays]|uniref:Uncharacterized protein n=1 Tax=Zea mays TaxID=4577 RepID=A0A3L6DES6_MAIZE|nr:hypothetical protein Zm00014a_001747 [Zea mays]